MRFTELIVERFGPYYEHQSIPFPRVRRVVLVHGENEHGKTSFVNAIRWALYERALDRYGDKLPLVELINTESSRAGNWTMSVALRFEVDGVEYLLRRAVQPKDATITPHSDSDFETLLHMQVGGFQKRADEIQPEINRLLAESISRFFLFDGEMLKQYEELVRTDTPEAKQIKSDIENLLGVPALINAITDLEVNLRDAFKRQQALAKRHQAAEVFVKLAEGHQEKIAQLGADVVELRTQAEDRRRQLLNLQEELDQTQAVEAEAVQMQELRRRQAVLKQEQAEKVAERAMKLIPAWKDLVQRPVQARLRSLREESDRHFATLQEVTAVRQELATLEILASGDRCPTCGQVKSTVDVDAIAERRKAIETRLTTIRFDEAGFARTKQSISRLEGLRSASVAGYIQQLDDRLADIQIEYVEIDQKQDEINETLKGHDQVTIARNRSDYITITKELGVIEDKIKVQEEEIARAEEEIRGLRAQIGKHGGPELGRLNREVKTYEELQSIFRAALAALRNELKAAIEAEASAIFRDLAADKTYSGLEINENYGLSIIAGDGYHVPVRSAGAEQLVALSLIGALNRNAVRRGPIVMDTPFGRLDKAHRENILRFIPKLAEQVTLLVISTEFDTVRDMPIIADQIDGEFTIVKERGRSHWESTGERNA